MSSHAFWDSGWVWQLAVGTLFTIMLSVASYILALVISLFFSISNFLGYQKIILIERIYIYIFRSLPEIVVIFGLFYVATTLGQSFSVTGSWVGIISVIIALGLISGSYLCNTFRAGLPYIEPGQIEAARALSFSTSHIVRRIFLPQLIGYCVKPALNIWLVLIKDTSMVSIVGIGELVFKANLGVATTLDPFLFYSLAGGIYLVITWLSTRLLCYLSGRINQGTAGCTG